MVKSAELPEIFIGLAAPIGTDLNCVEEEIISNLKSFQYNVIIVRVSELISRLCSFNPLRKKLNIDTPLRTMRQKINAGNRIRSVFGRPDILAMATCSKIQLERFKINTEKLTPEEIDALSEEENYSMKTAPVRGTVYLIRQLKRPEEVSFLRNVYGSHFILISAGGDINKRLVNLKNEIGKTQVELSPKDRLDEARSLIDEDSEQDDKAYGQLISSTFHLADFFVDASHRNTVATEIQRFMRGLFGSNRISPTKDEYGAYFAKAASLKTVDTSRQVGAAIFNESGEIVSMGCNDVAKSGGGHFWEEDTQKFRDIDVGNEANKDETSVIVFDFLKTLERLGALKEGSSAESVISNTVIKSAIGEAMVSEITEYGRMIHAEMSAIMDAARLGRPLKEAVLYVTTYPCHNCAKHIVASGIRRVVYIEPYPKSRASTLYGHAISEKLTTETVCFQHFYGISPRIYRNIFEKTRKRRDSEGRILEWCEGVPYPLIRSQDYDLAEFSSNEEFWLLVKTKIDESDQEDKSDGK